MGVGLGVNGSQTSAQEEEEEKKTRHRFILRRMLGEYHHKVTISARIIIHRGSNISDSPTPLCIRSH